MGYFDNAIDKAAPKGSSIAKPLMKVFIAALASGALRESRWRQRQTESAFRSEWGYWEDWVGCWKSFSRVVKARR